MSKGFPNAEPCEHGAGAGAICEECAGPVNFQLELLHSLKRTVRQLAGDEDVDAETLAEAVRVKDVVTGWATDREICSAKLGPCACFRCAGERR